MAILIAEKKNTEDGYTVIVSQVSHDRYSVRLRDDDSGEFLPTGYLTKDLEQAMKYANGLITGEKELHGHITI